MFTMRDLNLVTCRTSDSQFPTQSQESVEEEDVDQQAIKDECAAIVTAITVPTHYYRIEFGKAKHDSFYRSPKSSRCHERMRGIYIESANRINSIFTYIRSNGLDVSVFKRYAKYPRFEYPNQHDFDKFMWWYILFFKKQGKYENEFFEINCMSDIYILFGKMIWLCNKRIIAEVKDDEDKKRKDQIMHLKKTGFSVLSKYNRGIRAKYDKLSMKQYYQGFFLPLFMRYGISMDWMIFLFVIRVHLYSICKQTNLGICGDKNVKIDNIEDAIQIMFWSYLVYDDNLDYPS